jgi:hypothetical protein
VLGSNDPLDLSTLQRIVSKPQRGDSIEPMIYDVCEPDLMRLWFTELGIVDQADMDRTKQN